MVYAFRKSSPQKEREGRATDMERVEMVRCAIAGNPHFFLSLAEMDTDGYSYTYRTLETLKREHPDTDYYFIIGADSLFNLHTWKTRSVSVNPVLW